VSAIIASLRFAHRERADIIDAAMREWKWSHISQRSYNHLRLERRSTDKKMNKEGKRLIEYIKKRSMVE